MFAHDRCITTHCERGMEESISRFSNISLKVSCLTFQSFLVSKVFESQFQLNNLGMSVTLFIINKIRGVSNSLRSACLQISIIMFLMFLKQYDNNLTLHIATYLCQTMSPKYRYKFRCFCNALFSCSRLILLIQTNVLKLYREILTERLATSALCSPSNEECHLVLRPDKRFSCLRRIRRQRNQLYPFLQILEACFDV